jgi:hypothetical protein
LIFLEAFIQLTALILCTEFGCCVFNFCHTGGFAKPGRETQAENIQVDDEWQTRAGEK